MSVAGRSGSSRGDLAYTLGYEHVVFSIQGGPVAPLTLRVTHLYRRETANGGSSTAMPTPAVRHGPSR
jgi:hypothetical protein